MDVPKQRGRDLGLAFPGNPGPFNAVTDVPGVRVGMTTLIHGEGETAIRTGVTAIIPKERGDAAVWAGAHSFNGNGEMTGLHWVGEAGWFRGPVLLTNTHAVGVAHRAAVGWTRERYASRGDHGWVLPVVAETCDNWLNDMDTQAVTDEHVRAALDTAASGPVREGSHGGGTGMIAYELKAGTGTSSRLVSMGGATYRLGVLVQANFGRRRNLTILGKPVGTLAQAPAIFTRDQGSLIGVLVTDAPLHPLQLQRVARRMVLGMARTGSFGGDGSGDIFLAFTTAADPLAQDGAGLGSLTFVSGGIDALFEAAVDATEEAIVNALVAGETMTGRLGRTVHGLDHALLGP